MGDATRIDFDALRLDFSLAAAIHIEELSLDLDWRLEPISKVQHLAHSVNNSSYIIEASHS